MAANDAQLRHAVARIAVHDRYHPDDAEGRARLLEELRTAQGDAWVRQVVATAPPLSDEQRQRLAALVLGNESAA